MTQTQFKIAAWYWPAEGPGGREGPGHLSPSCSYCSVIIPITGDGELGHGSRGGPAVTGHSVPRPGPGHLGPWSPWWSVCPWEGDHCSTSSVQASGRVLYTPLLSSVVLSGYEVTDRNCPAPCLVTTFSPCPVPQPVPSAQCVVSSVQCPAEC
jgi:hypothetical protein